MDFSTSSDGLHSLASASDSSDIIPIIPRKSRMGNLFDILTKMQTLLMTGILVYLFYEYSSQRDGEWSDWENWSVCKDGLSKRSRHCINPHLSVFWRSCHGDSIEYKTCKLVYCTDEKHPSIESLHSDTSKYAAEMDTKLLSVLLQRTGQLEINFEKLEIFIENVNKQVALLQDNIKTESEEKLLQASTISSLSTDHDAFKQELSSKVKAIKDKEDEDLLQFKDQITDAIKRGKEKTKLLSTSVTTIQLAIETLKEHISKLTSHNEWRQEIDKIRATVKQQAQDTINEIKLIKKAFVEFKLDTNKNGQEQTTATVEEIKLISTEITSLKHAFDTLKTENKRYIKEKTAAISNDHLKIKKQLEGRNVAFTAHSLDRKLTTDAILHFNATDMNIGNAYSIVTGIFKCPIAGTYHFSVTLTKQHSLVYSSFAYLKINGSHKIILHLKFLEKTSTSLTASGTFHLKKNDIVYVTGRTRRFKGKRYSIFTGYLVIPDT